MITELVNHATLSEMDYGPTDPGRTWCECKAGTNGCVGTKVTVKFLSMHDSAKCEQPARSPKIDEKLSAVTSDRYVTSR